MHWKPQQLTQPHLPLLDAPRILEFINLKIDQVHNYVTPALATFQPHCECPEIIPPILFTLQVKNLYCMQKFQRLQKY